MDYPINLQLIAGEQADFYLRIENDEQLTRLTEAVDRAAKAKGFAPPREENEVCCTPCCFIPASVCEKINQITMNNTHIEGSTVEEASKKAGNKLGGLTNSVFLKCLKCCFPCLSCL